MAIRWLKLGLVVAPPLRLPWSSSHVALPTVDTTEGTLYFATRDDEGRSWVGRGELDLAADVPRLVKLEPEPALAPGPLGAFDDAGVTPSSVVRVGGELWLYYTGWSLGVTVPFYLAVGLAVSRDGGPFERASLAPIFGRTRHDPFLTASPHVLREGKRWRMWYVSGARWSRSDGQVRHHYHLRYGESADGIEWDTDGRACVDFADEREHAFSRPSVLRTAAGYEMWYSVRGHTYRLGYARSRDGTRWERRDAESGLEPSAAGWDSEMVAYPYVFEHGGRLLMLYNGNGYGASGIGAAVDQVAA